MLQYSYSLHYILYYNYCSYNLHYIIYYNYYIATVNIIVIVTEFLFTEINLCSEQSVCPMNSNCSMVSPGRFNCLCQEGFIMNHLSVCEGNFFLIFEIFFQLIECSFDDKTLCFIFNQVS